MTGETPFIPLCIALIAFALIVFAIIVIILWHTNKRLFKIFTEQVTEDFKNYKSQLEAQNKTFAKQIMETVAKQQHYYDNQQHLDKDLFNTFVKLRNSIKENCAVTMTSIKASRLAIYLFHNGTHSTHGINFFKMSCICEKVAIGSGVRERLIEHSNIPINLFDDMIDKLITNGRYLIMNDENLGSSSHKIFISSNKIKYAQTVAIFDINNNILGFVVSEMEHNYVRETALAEKEKLELLTSQLVPILAYSEYVNTTIEATKQHE